MEKEIKVAMVLYTGGLEYDDRIRKEILSIQNLLPNVKFTIFAIVPENKEQSGVTDYGVPYHMPFLKSREKYASRTHTLIKAFDFYRTVRPRLKDFDVVWCADIETFLLPLLLPKSTRLVWDLHEIPSHFVANGFMKRIFRYMEKKCKVMYHANQPRIEYLLKERVIKDRSKHIALRNFPESLTSSLAEKDDKFSKFTKWLDNRKCVYIQGISGPDRKAYETISAVLKIHDLCGVVVGPVDKNQLSRIMIEYPAELIDQKIYFTGKIPQKMTKLYIKECIVSLVFYATNSPNNIYCEPNRMFQSIMMGIPVVVGNNPSMKDVVTAYNAGIVLDNDGSDIKSIINAIQYIENHYQHFKDNVLKNRHKLCWDHQEPLLAETFQELVLN